MHFTGKEIKDGNGVIIGKVINSKWNCGLAIIEKDLLINSSNPIFKIEEEKISIYDPITLWDSIKSIIEDNNKKVCNESEESENRNEVTNK